MTKLEKAKKLAELQGVLDSLRNVSDTMRENIDAMFQVLELPQESSTVTREQIIAAFEAIASDITSKVYEKTSELYTDEELDALIAHLEGPLGKRSKEVRRQLADYSRALSEDGKIRLTAAINQIMADLTDPRMIQ